MDFRPDCRVIGEPRNSRQARATMRAGRHMRPLIMVGIQVDAVGKRCDRVVIQTVARKRSNRHGVEHGAKSANVPNTSATRVAGFHVSRDCRAPNAIVFAQGGIQKLFWFRAPFDHFRPVRVEGWCHRRLIVLRTDTRYLLRSICVWLQPAAFHFATQDCERTVNAVVDRFCIRPTDRSCHGSGRELIYDEELKGQPLVRGKCRQRGVESDCGLGQDQRVVRMKFCFSNRLRRSGKVAGHCFPTNSFKSFKSGGYLSHEGAE